MTGVSPLVTVIATQKLGKRTSKLVCSLTEITLAQELYAKVASHSLTALKMCSKCSFIPYKLRFFAHFRLVMKRDPTFAYASQCSALYF